MQDPVTKMRKRLAVNAGKDEPIVLMRHSRSGRLRMVLPAVMMIGAVFEGCSGAANRSGNNITIVVPEQELSGDSHAAVVSHHSAPDGKQLFQNHCATCHNPLLPNVGLSLRELLRERDEDFLNRFMTERELLYRTDPQVRESVQIHGDTCPRFPNLSRDEARSITSFVIGCRGLPRG
jgi:hypothetical protein